MENKKQYTSNVHYNNKIVIDVAQTSHMTSLQVLWPIYSIHKGFIYYWLLINNL